MPCENESPAVSQLAASSSYYSAATEIGQEVSLDQMIEAAASEEVQLAASASLHHSAATEMAKEASLDDLTLEAAASEEVLQLVGSTSSDHSAVEIGQEVSLEQMIAAAASEEVLTLDAAASEEMPQLAASSSSGSSSVTDNTQEEVLDVTFVDEATEGAASLDGRWNVCTLDLPCGLDLELTIGGEPLPRDAEAKELEGLQEASPSSYGHPVSPLSFRLVPAVVTVGTAETRRSGDETEKVAWWERLQRFSSNAFEVFEAVETSTCDLPREEFLQTVQQERRCVQHGDVVLGVLVLRRLRAITRMNDQIKPLDAVNRDLRSFSEHPATNPNRTHVALLYDGVQHSSVGKGAIEHEGVWTMYVQDGP